MLAGGRSALRVAAVQLNSTADRAANLAVADRLTRAAAADGACLIVLPEKWTAMGGEEIVLSQTAGGAELGLSVCYDLRFPELYRILAVLGARILTVPSAFTLQTTRDHWETLLRARAIENQAFVVAANQVGRHPAGQHSGGRSMIVDPWGVVLAQAPDGAGHIVADLDLEAQLEIRSRLPSLANRQPAAYRWPREVPA
jgi:predicted amidohydrolase